MKKKYERNLFVELVQGIEEIKNHKDGKITLRTCKCESKKRPKVDAKFVRETREWLNMSRNVFAIRLRVSPRTLEKWEQGETIPNDQASALILMTRKYPDTLRRLERI
ncbi:MAG: helix-turn-helix domain-containing protein [bacterium]